MVNIKFTIDSLLHEIIGKDDDKSKIIKINRKNLCESGDLWFPTNLLAWINLIKCNEIHNASRNILEHYLGRHNVKTADYSDEEVKEKALNLLISVSKSWILSVERASIQKEKVCLYLNRPHLLTAAIKSVLRNEETYGEQLKTGKSICLTINVDRDSELTTVRLNQLKNAYEKILKLHGYIIKNDAPDYKYCLTSKSQGHMSDENCEKYVCGVVKNPVTNIKETSLDFETYLQCKIRELAAMNESKLSDRNDNQSWLKTIAEAIVAFEFLCVKSSQSCFLQLSCDTNEKILNNKGGAFVLYNAVRITAILEKFRNEELSGNYPKLWNIDSVDFGKLTTEDEWSLVFNFILGYSDMITRTMQNNTKHEFHIHILCSFLLHLCQRFSIYYRRYRILTQGRDSLISTMMARLYLLEALKIVVNKCLGILSIVPICRM